MAATKLNKLFGNLEKALSTEDSEKPCTVSDACNKVHKELAFKLQEEEKTSGSSRGIVSVAISNILKRTIVERHTDHLKKTLESWHEGTSKFQETGIFELAISLNMLFNEWIETADALELYGRLLHTGYLNLISKAFLRGVQEHHTWCMDTTVLLKAVFYLAQVVFMHAPQKSEVTWAYFWNLTEAKDKARSEDQSHRFLYILLLLEIKAQTQAFLYSEKPSPLAVPGLKRLLSGHASRNPRRFADPWEEWKSAPDTQEKRPTDSILQACAEFALTVVDGQQHRLDRLIRNLEEAMRMYPRWRAYRNEISYAPLTGFVLPKFPNPAETCNIASVAISDFFIILKSTYASPHLPIMEVLDVALDLLTVIPQQKLYLTGQFNSALLFDSLTEAVYSNMCTKSGVSLVLRFTFALHLNVVDICDRLSAGSNGLSLLSHMVNAQAKQAHTLACMWSAVIDLDRAPPQGHPDLHLISLSDLQRQLWEGHVEPLLTRQLLWVISPAAEHVPLVGRLQLIWKLMSSVRKTICMKQFSASSQLALAAAILKVTRRLGVISNQKLDGAAADNLAKAASGAVNAAATYCSLWLEYVQLERFFKPYYWEDYRTPISVPIGKTVYIEKRHVPASQMLPQVAFSLMCYVLPAVGIAGSIVYKQRKEREVTVYVGNFPDYFYHAIEVLCISDKKAHAKWFSSALIAYKVHEVLMAHFAFSCSPRPNLPAKEVAMGVIRAARGIAVSLSAVKSDPEVAIPLLRDLFKSSFLHQLVEVALPSSFVTKPFQPRSMMLMPLKEVDGETESSAIMCLNAFMHVEVQLSEADVLCAGAVVSIWTAITQAKFALKIKDSDSNCNEMSNAWQSSVPRILGMMLARENEEVYKTWAVIRGQTACTMEKGAAPVEELDYFLMQCRKPGVVETSRPKLKFRPDLEALRKALGDVQQALERNTWQGKERSRDRTLSPTVPVGCWSLTCSGVSGRSDGWMKTKICARCRRARYCCRGCQTADWLRHKGLCTPYSEK